MKVINYRIELLEPALVTSVQGDPNSAVAFDYLPGSESRMIKKARSSISPSKHRMTSSNGNRSRNRSTRSLAKACG